MRAKRRFLRITKTYDYSEKGHCLSPHNLTVSEISEAASWLVTSAQGESYKEKLVALKANKPVKGSSSLAKLDPFLEDGVIRVDGRIRHYTFPYSLEHQIVLPNKGTVTNLLIKNAHTQLGLAGLEHVLSFLRDKFWIISGNSALRRRLLNCVKCKKKCSSTCTQKMAQLPAERLTPNKPAFTWPGLDYFCPFTHVMVGDSE